MGVTVALIQYTMNKTTSVIMVTLQCHIDNSFVIWLVIVAFYGGLFAFSSCRLLLWWDYSM